MVKNGHFFQVFTLKLTKETHFSQAVFGHFKKNSSLKQKSPKTSVNYSKLNNFPSRIHFFLLKVLNLIDFAEKLAQTEAKLNLMRIFREILGENWSIQGVF